MKQAPPISDAWKSSSASPLVSSGDLDSASQLPWLAHQIFFDFSYIPKDPDDVLLFDIMSSLMKYVILTQESTTGDHPLQVTLVKGSCIMRYMLFYICFQFSNLVESVGAKSVLACLIKNIGIDRRISALKRQGNNNAEQLHFEEEERGEDNLLPADSCSSLGSFQEEHDYITRVIIITLLIFPTVKQGIQGHI